VVAGYLGSLGVSKSMTRAVKSLSLIAASVVVFALAGMVLAVGWFSPSADEVARIPSPQGELEAVLIEVNGGATTSFAYEVFVLPRGTKQVSHRVAYLYGAARNSNAYGATLRWVSSSELEVEFEKAKLAQVEQPVTDVSGRTVRVALRSGVTDLTAPSGGMFYNLRGRQ